jgi:pyridoxine 4-dehydrogenase
MIRRPALKPRVGQGGFLKASNSPGVDNKLPQLGDTGTVQVGDYRFKRLGLGAMRLLSSNLERDGKTIECFAEPVDPDANREMMQAAVNECGIGYIDFARGYGAWPGAGESFFRQWMSPYPEDLLWATKVGYDRDTEGSWVLNLSPETIRRDVRLSVEELGAPLPLLYLMAGSTKDVTIRNRQQHVTDSFRPLLDAYNRGEVKHLGIANVSASELKTLMDFAPISVVQNKFTVASLADAGQREVLDLCRQHNIPFVAWGIFQSDDFEDWKPEPNLIQAAQELSATVQDASIAILLQAAPHLVALTGASRRKSLTSSVLAANLPVPPEILKRFGPDLGC